MFIRLQSKKSQAAGEMTVMTFYSALRLFCFIQSQVKMSNNESREEGTSGS